MNENNAESLMKEYDSQLGLFKDCTARVEELVRTILTSKNIRVHSVSSRHKDRDSYERKISKEPGKYSEMSEITDVSGIRIITYFHDEVDHVAKVIEPEFDIDKDNSVDKRSSHATDSFGYLSLHYVASFSPTRLELPEYSRYNGLKFEIQIRSILQHAWAEIEHDYGYKSNVDLPKEIRRRFSRLAGLLEIGDNEFGSIRDAIENYKSDLSTNIASNLESVELDQVSIKLFTQKSKQIELLGSKFKGILNSLTNNEFENTKYVTNLLKYLGYAKLSEVEDDLSKYSKEIIKYAKATVNIRKEDKLEPQAFYPGLPLVYLAFFRVMQHEKVEDARSMLISSGYATRASEIIAKRIYKTYKASQLIKND